jgi:hypothetical protein
VQPPHLLRRALADLLAIGAEAVTAMGLLMARAGAPDGTDAGADGRVRAVGHGSRDWSAALALPPAS